MNKRWKVTVIIVGWIGMTIITAGELLPHIQAIGNCADADKWYRADLRTSLLFAVLPPMWITAPLASGFWEHGWRLTRRPDCELTWDNMIPAPSLPTPDEGLTAICEFNGTRHPVNRDLVYLSAKVVGTCTTDPIANHAESIGVIESCSTAPPICEQTCRVPLMCRVRICSRVNK